MSLQTIPTTRPNNPFFGTLPDELIQHVFGYLKGPPPYLDRALIATETVCKDWQSNLILREERASATPRIAQSIEAQFPQALVQAFQHYHTRLGLLPVLNLGAKMGTRDYIDYLSPAQMTQSVMQFNERCGRHATRPGVAFKIHSRERDYTLAIFQRYIGDRDHWAVGSENGNTVISGLYHKRHAATAHNGSSSFFNNCQGCLVFEGAGNTYARQIPEQFLPNLLRGQDPDFSL